MVSLGRLCRWSRENEKQNHGPRPVTPFYSYNLLLLPLEEWWEQTRTILSKALQPQFVYKLSTNKCFQSYACILIVALGYIYRDWFFTLWL